MRGGKGVDQILLLGFIAHKSLFAHRAGYHHVGL
jgi:hypothetical protein